MTRVLGGKHSSRGLGGWEVGLGSCLAFRKYQFLVGGASTAYFGCANLVRSASEYSRRDFFPAFHLPDCFQILQKWRPCRAPCSLRASRITRGIRRAVIINNRFRIVQCCKCFLVSVVPTAGSLEFADAPPLQPCWGPFGRLSRRKRRIIRSPLPRCHQDRRKGRSFRGRWTAITNQTGS